MQLLDHMAPVFLACMLAADRFNLFEFLTTIVHELGSDRTYFRHSVTAHMIKSPELNFQNTHYIEQITPAVFSTELKT